MSKKVVLFFLIISILSCKKNENLEDDYTPSSIKKIRLEEKEIDNSTEKSNDFYNDEDYGSEKLIRNYIATSYSKTSLLNSNERREIKDTIYVSLSDETIRIKSLSLTNEILESNNISSGNTDFIELKYSLIEVKKPVAKKNDNLSQLASSRIFYYYKAEGKFQTMNGFKNVSFEYSLSIPKSEELSISNNITLDFNIENYTGNKLSSLNLYNIGLSFYENSVLPNKDVKNNSNPTKYRDLPPSKRNKKALTEHIKEMYKDIMNNNFNASDYYSDNVDIFLTRKNIKSSEITKLYRNEKEYINQKFTIINDTYSYEVTDNITYYRYTVDYNCFRVSKNKNQSCKMYIEIGMGEDGIISYKELKVENINFY